MLTNRFLSDIITVALKGGENMKTNKDSFEFKLAQDFIALMDARNELQTEFAKNLVESALQVIENKVSKELNKND